MQKLIKNYDSLVISEQRKTVLDLIETGLESIEPEHVLAHNFSLDGSRLHISNEVYELTNYDRIFLIGFGKGSAGIAKIIETTLGDKLSDGYVIDTVEQEFSKIHFTLGTHPLPSQQNIDFTNTVLEKMIGLTQRDLVLVVICGGGSAMFESPFKLDLAKLDAVFTSLIKSGATISEMNIIRKHLSNVKGGGLAMHLYPATIASLLFSDVPGSNPSVIASGPIVKETSTMVDVKNILHTYHITDVVDLADEDFAILPQDEKYFEHVTNIVMLSDKTIIDAMTWKAMDAGYPVTIFSDRLQGNAKEIGRQLLDKAEPGSILLAGGETTVEVKGSGQGGRNQTVVLAALPYLEDGDIIASVGTDGVDFYYFAGAIGDKETMTKAISQGLDIQTYLDNDDSYNFFTKVNDGIYTGKLESNVADIIIIYKSLPSQDSKQTIVDLMKKANKARELVISTLVEAGSGHSAGSLGMADVFTALYFHVLHHDPQNPGMEDRDRLILSNGHICPILYVTMAMAGYFPIEELQTLRKINSRLQGHPHREALPGLETSSGPLGEGLGQAVGMALAAKMDKKSYYIYCLTSDGEHEEGSVWEAVMAAGDFKLDHIIQIIDYNNIQIDANVSKEMPLEPFKQKYESFKWNVIEIDGNDMEAILHGIEKAKQSVGKPTLIIAHTIPGKGISFMENNYLWHGKVPSAAEAEDAFAELKKIDDLLAIE